MNLNGAFYNKTKVFQPIIGRIDTRQYIMEAKKTIRDVPENEEMK